MLLRTAFRYPGPFPGRMLTTLLGAMLFFTLAASPVPAQSQASQAPEMPRPGPADDGPQADLELRGYHLFNADLESDQGKVAVTQARADASWSRYSLSWHTNWYSWENKSALPYGDGRNAPWDSLHVLTFMVNHRDQLSSRWSYFIQGAIRSGFEKQLSRSLGVAVNGGLIYAWKPDWNIGIGGFIGADPTSKFAFSSTFAMFGPFVQYRHPRAPGLSGRLGFPQSELRYTGSPFWSTWLGFGIDSDTYRLADDSTVMPRGYVRERMFTTGLHLDITPTPSLLLRVGPTYNFGRRQEFFDSGGGKRRSHDLDATLGVAAMIHWRF